MISRHGQRTKLSIDQTDGQDGLLCLHHWVMPSCLDREVYSVKRDAKGKQDDFSPFFIFPNLSTSLEFC